jgi:integrase
MSRLTPNKNRHKHRIALPQKQIITVDEFNSLLEVVDDIALKAAVSILWERGVRIGMWKGKHEYTRQGLLGLNWGDIDFEKCTMEIHLKAGKSRIMPLGELSEKYLRQLKESRNNEKIGPTDPIFVSSKGRMTFCRFYRKLREYMKKAGISKAKMYPRIFRFTCGTRVTKEYGVYVAMQLLGHSQSQTTRTHVHISTDDLIRMLRPDKSDKKLKMKECPNCGVKLSPNRKLCLCGYDFSQNSRRNHHHRGKHRGT